MMAKSCEIMGVTAGICEVRREVLICEILQHCRPQNKVSQICIISVFPHLAFHFGYSFFSLFLGPLLVINICLLSSQLSLFVNDLLPYSI